MIKRRLGSTSTPVTLAALLQSSRMAVLAGSLLIAAMLPLMGCDSGPSGSAAGSSTAAGTVQLEIDFRGKRANISVDVPCSLDSTVFQIMERARNMGDLEFESTGSDDSAFISSIGGIENEGRSGDNWVFRVNDELGDRGCGVIAVNKSDHILWVLGKYP